MEYNSNFKVHYFPHSTTTTFLFKIYLT